jgi:hypothetical protein
MLSRRGDVGRGRPRFAVAAVAMSVMASIVIGPPSAHAARPQPGGHYSDCTSASCSVGFAVSRDGRSVRGFSVYARCTPAPPAVRRMRINSSGEFSYRGTMRVGDRRIRVELSARFVSRRLARGTVRYRGERCDTRRMPFRATRDSAR